MFAIPDVGYLVATWILGFVLLFSGLKTLIYFFSMGIHMVGGRTILYRALITLDVGIFTLTIQGTGQRYILCYFMLYYLFAGIVAVFRALESRRLEAGSWKLNFASGVFDMAVVLVCLVHNNSESIMLDILCFALIMSGITRIGKALRRNAIVYIQ